MQTATLNAAPRSESGKNATRELRRQGRVPAVIYGHGEETRSLSVDALELEKLLASISVENTLIDVKIDGGATARTLIREVQWHPFKPVVLHVDFYQVHAGEKIKLDVPVRLLGSPVGVRDFGGVLQQVLHELHVECLPRDIPDAIEIDVENLGIGDSVHVKEVSVPNVTITNDPELVICTVSAPTVAALPEEPVAEEGVGEVEPELVRRRREEEEEADTTGQGD